MMQITRQADYAVRAVLYLAERGGSARVTTAEISREKQIPLTFLAKIMSQLTRAGIVRSTRGAHGGMAIGGPLTEISLLHIVEAIDGPVVLNECVSDPSICPLGADCVVHSVWCQAQADLVARLSRTTLAELVKPAVPVAAPARELLPISMP
jgi:Rrf2 family protein